MKHDYDDYDALASMLTAGSQWQNKRGKLLTVLAIANDNLPERYAELCPISVVYMDEQGRVFSLRADIFLHNYEYVLVDEVFAEYIDQIYAYNAGEIDALGLASSKDARDFMGEADDAEEVEVDEVKVEVKPEVKSEVKVEKRPLTLAEQLVKPAARFFDSNDVERTDYAEAFAGFEFADYSESNRTIKLIFNADVNLSYSDFNNGRFIIDDDLNDVHEEYRLGTVYYCGNEYADGNLRKIVLVNYPYLVSVDEVVAESEVAVDPEIEQIVPDNTVENQENEELISQVVPEAEETAEYEPQGFINGEPVSDTPVTDIVEATEAPVEVVEEANDNAETEATESVEANETAEGETEQTAERTTEATEVSADAEVSIDDVEVVSNFPKTHVDIPQPTVDPQQNTALSDALVQAQQMTIAHRVVK